jgi:hypothetical protein
VSNRQRNGTHTAPYRDRGVTHSISAPGPWILGGLVVFLLLVAFTYRSIDSHFTSPAGVAQPPQPPSQFHSAGNGLSGQPVGLPAITPHLNLNTSNAAVASLPTYTAADAIAYADANPPTGMTSLAPFAVTGVQFMTDAQADQQLQTVIGLAPTALVCVVEVHGRFQALLLGAAPANLPTFDLAYEVFDGRTGNFLVSAEVGSSVEH